MNMYIYMYMYMYMYMALCHLRAAKRFSGFAIEPALSLTRVPIRASQYDPKEPIRARPIRAQGAHKGPGGP